MDVALAGFVEDDIKFRVDLRVVVKMVDGWGNDAVLEGEDGGDGFNGASSSEEVTRHRLGGVDADVVGMFAKHLLNSHALSQIAHRRRSAVRIDMVNGFGS